MRYWNWKRYIYIYTHTHIYIYIHTGRCARVSWLTIGPNGHAFQTGELVYVTQIGRLEGKPPRNWRVFGKGIIMIYRVYVYLYSRYMYIYRFTRSIVNKRYHVELLVTSRSGQATNHSESGYASIQMAIHVQCEGWVTKISIQYDICI